MKTVILVNGVPASGKSTTAKLISQAFDWPYLSIDTIKEPFMDIEHSIDRDRNRELGKAAYQAIWQTITDAPSGCVYVIDAWFGFQPRSLLQEYLHRAGIEQVIEVWNQISPEHVSQRYKERLAYRKEGHPGEEYLPELHALTLRAQPLKLGGLLIVDQDVGLDSARLLAEIEATLYATEDLKKLSNY